MKKYITILVAIIIISMIVGVNMEVLGQDEEEYSVLLKAFKHSDFQYVESHIEVKGVLNSGEETIEGLHNDIDKVINLYNPLGNWKKVSELKENQKSVQGTLANDDLIFQVSIINAQYENLWNTYFHIDVFIRKEEVLVANLMRDIDEIFSIYGINPETRITIRGIKPEKLKRDQIQNIEKKILQELKGKKEQIYSNNYSYSVYGYTRKIFNHYINPATKKKMNINIIFRYQESDNTTELYVASPLVDEAY